MTCTNPRHDHWIAVEHLVDHAMTFDPAEVQTIDGIEQVPMRCADCDAPTYYDLDDDLYRHVDDDRECFLIGPGRSSACVETPPRRTSGTTVCDMCGATSNSAPGLRCDWRADGLADDDAWALLTPDAARCPGTYVEVDVDALRAELSRAQALGLDDLVEIYAASLRLHDPDNSSERSMHRPDELS